MGSTNNRKLSLFSFSSFLFLFLFCTTSSSYNHSQAEFYFLLSAVAYCPDANIITSWTCIPCRKFGPSFTVTSTFSDSSTNSFGYVGYITPSNYLAYPTPTVPTTVIAFRGTVVSSLLNWITDLSFIELEPYTGYSNNAKVHSGFFNAYTALVPQGLLSGFQQAILATKTSQIIIIGHSLGGALSTLCAVDLRIKSLGLNMTTYPPDNWDITVYSTGSPRVGDQNFQSLYKSLNLPKTYRITHAVDPVVHLPTQFMGYEHVPTEIYYSRNFNNFTVCDGSGEDPNCADSETISSVSVGDHLHYFNIDIGGYCQCDVVSSVANLNASLDYYGNLDLCGTDCNFCFAYLDCYGCLGQPGCGWCSITQTCSSVHTETSCVPCLELCESRFYSCNQLATCPSSAVSFKGGFNYIALIILVCVSWAL